ncbi:MAG: hypothetical protein PSV35_00845, partial [bacterium]|nr:hypothetical protein [bacterium]
EDLWQAVINKQYGKVKEVIIANPELALVNEVNAHGNSVFMRLCNIKNCPLDLIEYVAKHPNFNLQHFNPEIDETNIDTVMSLARLDILKFFANDPRIIMNGDKLSYVSAKKYLAAAERQLKRDPSCDDTIKEVANLKLMVTILREITIRHAVKTDDPSLFEALEKAGDDLSVSMNDGIVPVDLLTQNMPQLDAWFNKRAEKMLDARALNPNSLFATSQKLKDIEEKMAAAIAQKAKADIEVMAKAMDNKLHRIEQVNQILASGPKK